MSDDLAAALVIFAFGLLSGVALTAVLWRRTRAISPSPRESVTLRMRAIRRTRVANIEQRVEALEERAVAPRAIATKRHECAQQSTADSDAIEALIALGFRRSEAVARLAAVGDAQSTTDRVTAVLRSVDRGRSRAE